MNRPALRAAIVVSGLTLGCGAGPAAPASTTPTGTTNESTANESTTETTNVSTSNETCDGSLELVSETCCNQTPGRAWSVNDGRCVFVAVPGPFVPPSVLG